MELTLETLTGVVTALGVGLLIGLDRERRKRGGSRSAAGVRTHPLLALSGAVAGMLGEVVLLTAGLAVAALAVTSYLRSRDDDLGLTSEIAMVLTFGLGVLAMQSATLAAGIGVVVAILLTLRARLHRLSRDQLSDLEVNDLLLLAGAVLVIWPLLPDDPVDPWGVLVPSSVWKFVVLVMGVGAVGHVLLRAVGAERGLPVAGFLAGFASSTAATAGFGAQSRQQPEVVQPAAAAAILANLASVLLFVVVVGAGSPALLRASAWPLAIACGVLLVSAGVLLVSAHVAGGPAVITDQPTHAFRLSHALGLGAVIAVVLLLSGWLQTVYGDSGVLVTAGLAAMVELQGAAVSVSQLVGSTGLSLGTAAWGLVALLATSSAVKSVLAFTSGGVRYGVFVTVGLGSMVAAAAAATALL